MTHALKTGDRVWYWTRRKGEPGHKQYGTIVHIDGAYARVRVDFDMVRVMEAKRLQPLDESDEDY